MSAGQQPTPPPTLEESIQAIQDAAKEDSFTYLTILEFHVKTPGILPALNGVLQDKEITSAIGWDLIDMLLPIDGYEPCLETVARLGNPKEVHLRLSSTFSRLADAWDIADAEDDGNPKSTTLFQHLRIDGEQNQEQQEYQQRPLLPKEKIPGAFVTLLGMLAVVHQRLQSKYPSRFLAATLTQILRAYRPTPEMTAAVINLVRSLSGRKRPPLPARSSSISVANPDEEGDSSRNVPDPEPESEEPDEDRKQRKQLQSFVTYILCSYVNYNLMRWSPRMLEKYKPERLIPGKPTNIDRYRQDETLLRRDAVVGQLASLALDVGIDHCPRSLAKAISESSPDMDILKMTNNFDKETDNIQLCFWGMLCLVAYWMFSTDVFAANHPQPEMYLFPDHLKLLEKFMKEDPPPEINRFSGLVDALLAIGLGLRHRSLITADYEKPNSMAYHHYLSIILVFHPDIDIRNAGTVYAGQILHAEPTDEKRFEILEDLFANCDYASLKSCAVQWLKEEIIEAKKLGSALHYFTNPDNIDRLQHYIFPDLLWMPDATNPQEVVEYWALNGIFLLQAANFAYFLFAGNYRDIVPPGMGAAVEHRFAEPLINAAPRIAASWGWEEEKAKFAVAVDRLADIPFH